VDCSSQSSQGSLCLLTHYQHSACSGLITLLVCSFVCSSLLHLVYTELSYISRGLTHAKLYQATVVLELPPHTVFLSSPFPLPLSCTHVHKHTCTHKHTCIARCTHTNTQQALNVNVHKESYHMSTSKRNPEL
jgi:hypothetical protein